MSSTAPADRKRSRAAFGGALAVGLVASAALPVPRGLAPRRGPCHGVRGEFRLRDGDTDRDSERAHRSGHRCRLGPDAIALSPSRATAYVVNGGSDSVTPIDTSTDRPRKAIRVGADPDAIAVTPNGRTAYVADAGSDSVTPIVALRRAARGPRSESASILWRSSSRPTAAPRTSSTGRAPA